MLVTDTELTNLPHAACAQPEHDPDWWDVTNSAAANARAIAICGDCPERAACALQAALTKPLGVIQAGRRWDQKPACPTTN